MNLKKHVQFRVAISITKEDGAGRRLSIRGGTCGVPDQSVTEPSSVPHLLERVSDVRPRLQWDMIGISRFSSFGVDIAKVVAPNDLN